MPGLCDVKMNRKNYSREGHQWFGNPDIKSRHTNDQISPRFVIFSLQKRILSSCPSKFHFGQVHIVWWLSYCQVGKKISVEPWVAITHYCYMLCLFQLFFRCWFVVWRHKAISWINDDLLSIRHPEIFQWHLIQIAYIFIYGKALEYSISKVSIIFHCWWPIIVKCQGLCRYGEVQMPHIYGLRNGAIPSNTNISSSSISNYVSWSTK